MNNARRITGLNILLHFILMLICIGAQETGPPDIVLLQDVRLKQTTCVAGADTVGQGLTFITPVNQHIFHPEFKYKNINGSDIDISIGCDFENSKSCTSTWSNSNLDVIQSEYNFLPPVTDERWNKFNIIQTTGSDRPDYSNSQKYIIKTKNFRISFSVRTARDAQILLCESSYYGPKESPCYWLLIDAFGGKTTALRKCIKGIPDDYPRDKQCSERRAKIELQESLLSENEWRHFTISREKGNQIKLWETRRKDPLIHYTDTSNKVLNIKEMYFRGYDKAHGQWKVHDYSFVSISQGDTQTKLGPSIRFKEHIRVCLSLYVMMCSKCSMTIRLQNGRNNIEVTERGTYNAIRKWKNIRLIGDGLHTDVYDLYVQGSADTYESNPFWIIDDVRHCFIDEVRVASLQIDPKISVSCHSLKYPEWTFSDNSGNNFPSSAVQCTDPTRIGRYCNISCQAVKGTKYCEGNKICRVTRNSKSNVCTCASGYRWPTCETDCPDSFYGYNCANSCGNCKYNYACAKTSGECSSNGCNLAYSPPLCQIPLYPVLVTPLTVIKTSHTSITVQIDNDTTTGEEDVATFQIEFQNAEGNTDWIPYEQQRNFELGATVVINGLRLETTYSIRGILYTINGNAHKYNDVPVVNASTTCNVNRETVITPGKRNANITLSDNEENCLLTNYIYIVKTENIIIERNYFTNNVISIETLVPYTDYEVTIENIQHEEYNYTEKFKTLEDAPSEVENLQSISVTDASIILSWSPPKQPNGNIKYYVVTYKFKRYIECESDTESDPVSKTVYPLKNTQKELNNLLPYAVYEITVVAVTVEPGDGTPKFIKTLMSNSVKNSELPTELSVNPRATTAVLSWKIPECSERKGPLTYRILVNCVGDSWCSQEEDRILPNIEGSSGKFYLSELTPFTHYHIEIRATRPQSMIVTDNYKSVEFQTTEGVPPTVRNIKIFSRNHKTLSIRWLPPYPPHGYLEEYQLGYCSVWYETSVCTPTGYKNISPKPCNLWEEDYLCYHITNLSKDYVYTIGIRAKNKDVRTPGNINYDRAVTTQGVSTTPLNLSTIWVDNKLILHWNHPNITNGRITSFLITLQQNETEISGRNSKQLYAYTHKVETPMKSYSYEFNKSFPYSSSYILTICSLNDYYGKNKTITIDTPPETPELTESVLVDSAEITNVTIKINIPGVKGSTINRNSYVYVLVSEKKTESVSKRDASTEHQNTKNDILNYGASSHSWIAVEAEPSENTSSVVIGDDTTVFSKQLNENIHNKPLEPRKTYDMAVVLMNIYRNQRSFKSYNLDSLTTAESEVPISLTGLYALFLLLLLPIAFVVYRYSTRKTTRPHSLRMIPGISIVRPEGQHDPDIIPLTEASNEPSEVKQKKPIVSPKPGQSSKKLENGSNHTSQSNETVADTNFFHSRIVSLDNLENYIKEALENSDLEQQHALFPRGQTKPWNYGISKPNKFKNRYNNLIAYDKNRVKLEKINNDQHSDYINANYINGYKQGKAYIATQGPKLATLNDFWRMIWQEKVQYIVMLANVVEGGKKKCEKYWPEIDTSREYGDIDISYIKSEVYADYEFRTFQVTYKEETRQVTQLHFTSWPDHGVPLYPQSLVPFLKKILTIPQSTAPVVVHCSAGVGRTGTIILCDICLRMAAREKAVDILRYLHELREQRANMVDNIDQYKLVHMVLLECLLAPDTNIPCNNDLPNAVHKLIDEGGLQRQLNYMQQTAWQDKALNFASTYEPDPANASKNRVKDIVPLENRVYISRYPATDSNSDYINAVPVDGFRFKEQFIVTQTPLPNTLGDFWRMVVEKEVKVIVSLTTIPLQDKSCCIFWPSENGEMKPVPTISLKYHKTQSFDHYDIYTIILNNKNAQEEQKPLIQIVQFKNWNHKNKLPDNVENLVMLWEETENLSRGNYPMVVACYDGATASGLFVAMSFVIEKIKLEQQCDPCLAVRIIRRNRQQFVTDKVQFEFLYKSAIIYLSMFETYSNFQPVVNKSTG